MNKPSSLADNETVIEYFSSQTVRALKKQKQLRRRLILAFFVGTKILAAGLGYLAYGELHGSHTAAAADIPAFEAVIPSLP